MASKPYRSRIRTTSGCVGSAKQTGFHRCGWSGSWTDSICQHPVVIHGGVGAGAGKTPVLLSGIEKGWQVFSTELTHFAVEDGRCVVYKGGLFDNVRVGNLSEYFPAVVDRLGLKLPPVKDVWGTKICVDLRAAEAAPDRLDAPNLRFLFPRVEAGWERPVVTAIAENTNELRLYENGPGALNLALREHTDPRAEIVGVIDEVRTVTDREAYDMKTRLAREEGLLVGISAGANVFVAARVAEEVGPGKHVVTVLCDTGERYFSLDEYFEK